VANVLQEVNCSALGHKHHANMFMKQIDFGIVHIIAFVHSSYFEIL
jgi:hypothetical protein